MWSGPYIVMIVSVTVALTSTYSFTFSPKPEMAQCQKMTLPTFGHTFSPGRLSLPPVVHSPLHSVEPSLTELVALFPFPHVPCPSVWIALPFKSAQKCIFSAVFF